MSDHLLPAWFPGRLFPFRSRFAEIDGHLIHYIDEGVGPAILFFHGNPTWSFLYRDIVVGLRDQFRCIAFDMPGFGLSQARPGFAYTPEAHARVAELFVQSLDPGICSIMVQDWGGPIGLWVAARRRSEIDALIIGNTWAWPVNGDMHFEWFSRTMGGPLGRALIPRFNAFVNLLIPAGVKIKPLSREVMDAYRRPFPDAASRMATYLLPRAILHSRAFLSDVEGGLAGLSNKDVLILWGDRDIAFRTKERQRFERTFKASRTHILRGAGHFIQEDAPEAIVREIRVFHEQRKGRTANATPS
jgi:haloalkane dehalogenase